LRILNGPRKRRERKRRVQDDSQQHGDGSQCVQVMASRNGSLNCRCQFFRRRLQWTMWGEYDSTNDGSPVVLSAEVERFDLRSCAGLS
jgi:hypothetical protein